MDNVIRQKPVVPVYLSPSKIKSCPTSFACLIYYTFLTFYDRNRIGVEDSLKSFHYLYIVYFKDSEEVNT